MPTRSAKRGHELLADLDLIADSRVTSSRAAEQPDYATSECPTTSEPIAAVRLDDRAAYDAAVRRAAEIQQSWRMLPAPRRGEVIRLIADALRDRRDVLGEMISLEMGKIRAEAIGEVQEAVDIADFCVGLSRQLYGLTMHSERPRHRMYEQWHPLGTVGVITAFNFPVAVWSWNAMVAATCGNAIVWKPSLQTPLVSIALNNLVRRVMSEQDIFQPDDGDPADVFTLVIGTDETVGQAMTDDRRLPLISATGSCRMGRHVGQAVAGRLGRCLLELGGNNAMIVTAEANLDLATRAAVFGAVGTAGQRCTTTRRLIVHRDVADDVVGRLSSAYAQVAIGDPLNDETLMGPLISRDAIERMKQAIETAVEQGGEVICGGVEGIERHAERRGYFVEPTIIRVPPGTDLPVAREETFAPILYVFEFEQLDDAIAMHNSVDQGLSSAIMTDSLREAEMFLSHAGSDCGIANVNIGTSGAEIGGAFGGEKDTGGGRESGSDAWKNYMRRQTCTINWGDQLPLAQGISFDA